MSKRIALITGANKGIGFETARRLGQEGFVVIVGARSQVKADDAAARLTAAGLEAEGVVLDVTQPDHIAAAAAHIDKKFGKLDVLVNNAGIQQDGEWGVNTILTTPIEAWRATFETNVFGLIELTKATVELLKRSDAGRIVNVSSIMGSLTINSHAESPMWGVKPAAYDTSKSAVNAITIHLAQALADTPIKVNSAHPGWVKTDLGTDAAPLSVEEGAETSVALALLGEDGPSGGFFFNGDTLPW